MTSTTHPAPTGITGFRSAWCLVVILLQAAGTALATGTPPLPLLHADTLSGRAIELPRDLDAPVNVFVIGFTKASGADTAAWSKQLRAAIPADSAILYSVSVIEDVPKLMRGFVVRGIRSSVPAALHDRFLLVTRGSAQWRRVSGFDKTRPDAAISGR
jgi:hypothetical protein